MVFNRHKKLELLFLELCKVLKPKLGYVENSMEYVKVGEYGLALEFISDWCVDAEPEIQLTASELLSIKEVGDQINQEGSWIELLPLLIESDIALFPKKHVEHADDYLEKQLIDNPLREAWLSKVKRVIEKINNFEVSKTE